MGMTLKYTQAPEAVAGMYEELLARGDRQMLVTVHRSRITKITPVGASNVCAGVKRPLNGLVDNGVLLAKLLSQPFAQWLVTVCHGKLITLAPVEREAEVTEQDLADEDAGQVIPPLEIKSKKKQPG